MSTVYPKSPKLFTLKNASNMEVTIMDWGATIISIKVPVNGELKEMLIGPAHAEDYDTQSAYMGATIGRYANRINKCEFEIANQTYTIDANGAPVALHGGKEGFDKRRFECVESKENAVTFKLHSPDGDMGFPGNFDLTVKFELKDDGALDIHYVGECDHECPACITNHSYFNLNGHHSSVLKHEALFNSEEILVIDNKSIPTGEVYNVTKRTDKVDNFNFTKQKPLAYKGIDDFLDDKNMEGNFGYDHAFIIKGYGDASKPCATVIGEPIDGKRVKLEVYTDYPAFQFYSGNFLQESGAVARDDGQPYARHDGFAIEPEYFPDAPHLEAFKQYNPNVSKDAPLKKFITYKFTVI